MKKTLIFTIATAVITALLAPSGCESTKGAAPVLVRESSEEKLQIEIDKERRPSLQIPEIDFGYEYVAAFYQSICFNFDLINKVDKGQLRQACKIIYDSLKEKYRVQFIVKD